MSNQTEQPVEKGGFLSMVLILGGFFLFLAIVAFVWIDRQPLALTLGSVPPEERVRILRDQKARDQELLNEYGWIDRDAGAVRLPVERAMELVLEEINQGQDENAPRADARDYN